jgi:caffeoyl-CoA O-methyltransferase
MSDRTFGLDQRLSDYLLSVSVRESEPLARLREETRANPMAAMQISPEQGQFMALLMELMGARNTLEVGVFTGYSSLWVAQALPEAGRIIACDVNEEWTEMARRYWQEAGVAHKIDLRIAPAMETLDGLIAEGREGGFDFAFIDADKQSYPDYFERCLTLLRPGGLIAVDNTLWSGKVADPDEQSADTRTLRAFNQSVHDDQRVTVSLLPVGDGLTLALKR